MYGGETFYPRNWDSRRPREGCLKAENDGDEELKYGNTRPLMKCTNPDRRRNNEDSETCTQRSFFSRSFMHSTTHSLLRGRTSSQKSIAQFNVSLKESPFLQAYDSAYGDRLREREVFYFHQLFHELDTDGSGAISREEFLAAMKNTTLCRILSERFGFQPHHSERIFHLLQDRRTGEISLAQWIGYVEMLMSRPPGEEADIQTLLRQTALHRHRLPRLRHVAKKKIFKRHASIDFSTAKGWKMNQAKSLPNLDAYGG